MTRPSFALPKLPKVTPNMAGMVASGIILIVTAGLGQPTVVWLLTGAGGFFLARVATEAATKRR
jgi:hypothetical protein